MMNITKALRGPLFKNLNSLKTQKFAKCWPRAVCVQGWVVIAWFVGWTRMLSLYIWKADTEHVIEQYSLCLNLA